MVHIEDGLWIFLVFPQHCSEIGDQLYTKGSPLHLEPSVFLHRYILSPPLQRNTLLYYILNIDAYEKVVVLIVLEGYPVSHQEQPVGQPPIAEVDLRPCLELIFRTACHNKLVEFIHRP